MRGVRGWVGVVETLQIVEASDVLTLPSEAPIIRENVTYMTALYRGFYIDYRSRTCAASCDNWIVSGDGLSLRPMFTPPIYVYIR